MDGKLTFSLALSQQLKLTPNLVLGLELLQVPLVQLEEIIKNEVEENPLIEPLDFVYESSSTYYEPSESEESSPAPSPVSVREELLRQVNLEFEGLDKEIATFIVDNLDRRGLLSVPPDEVARRFAVPVERVEEVRERLKGLEPVGCGSLTLKELLKAQLREMGAPPKLVSAVEKLELLAEKERFMAETGLSEREFEELFSYLRHADLCPFDEGTDAVRIKPDLRVWLEGDKVKVEVLNPPWFNFKVNSYYLKHADREELKRYINEKYQRALYLKKAIDSRNQTLLKLAERLFSHQKKFLKDGKTLKPITISQLASEISLHESTVSRAVKDKFVETPFGIYPLRFFFKKGVSGTSVDRIKELIRELIEKEDKSKPLSDSKIASLLKEKGIKIARRTVAKYREEMGIPGAYERRRR